MGNVGMLTENIFKSIVKNTPLVSIDLIVRNKSNEILIGKRVNRPACGYWFVPGGRIRKDENMESAFLRLTNNELGLDISMSHGQFLGPFEHFYEDNFSNDNFSTHYIVLAFELSLDVNLEDLPPQQHSQYRWVTEKEMMESDLIHTNNRFYFQREKIISSKIGSKN